uniref:Uncharacterized protein n=1 Tax=Glossina brevipalpis TaxID=37001 RepID=A0A1A9X0C5_9MUSC
MKQNCKEKRDIKPFIYGGLASITAEFGTFPIDTTKTRLQIQGQKIDQTFAKLRYNGMTDAFIKITKEEGLNALFSGIWPAVLRQALYGTIKFGTYYTLKSFANDYGFLIDPKTGSERIWSNILCAASAGAISSAIANPTDVLKVRMQVHGKGNQQKSLWSCFHEIYKYEGVHGLWRGVGPTAQRAVAIASVELPVYDFCKSQLMCYFGDHIANHFVSSCIASLGSAIASTPIDVIRTRLMNQKRVTIEDGMAAATTQKIYTGSLDCVVQTVRNEGILALYKGFIPTWVRMGPWNSKFFSVSMKEHDIRVFAYGGLASILAEFGTFPIDTTKTRLQIQGQRIDKKFSQLRYRGMTDAFFTIAREEGVTALYSGVWPAVLRQAVYGTIKYGTYYSLKNFAREGGLLLDPKTGNERVWITVACAATAGVISSAFANPTDVLKVRMQVSGKGSQQKNLWKCFYEIYKYEGVKGLWRGVVPTTQRAIIITSVDLPVYDFCKSRLLNIFGDQPITHFISISSLSAAIASTPMDVVRTRLMNQKHLLALRDTTVTQNIYRGSLHCAMETVRHEGLMALYKGFIPAWMRMGPWNAIFFVTFEQLKKL